MRGGKPNSPLEEHPLGGGGQFLSTPSRKRATPQEGNNYQFSESRILKENML